jgi:hypothetical protein
VGGRGPVARRDPDGSHDRCTLSGIAHRTDPQKMLEQDVKVHPEE